MIQTQEVFLPINKDECEIFRTIALLSRLNNGNENLRETLKEEYENKPEDIQVKFAYALYNIMLTNPNDVLESKSNVENALEVFEEIIEERPSCWLAQMYRIRILSMLPNSYRDEESIIEDINLLIETQNNSEYQPYFVIPYILLAGLYWSMGEDEEATLVIEDAQKLEKSKIIDIPDFLIIFFEELETKLKNSGDDINSTLITNLKSNFF